MDDLIAAFASVSKDFPGAALYLVGEGPERQEFEAQAAATECSDRIHFIGFVKDPRCYLEQSDIFVLASRADPFPLVIPEAREAGCAIVAAPSVEFPKRWKAAKPAYLFLRRSFGACGRPHTTAWKFERTCGLAPARGREYRLASARSRARGDVGCL